MAEETSNSNGNGGSTQVRRWGEIKTIKNSESPRLIVYDLLNIDECFDRVWPYISADGKTCGHKVIDAVRACDVLREVDGVNGGRLKRAQINDYQLVHALIAALRMKLTLNKQWKVVGENEKKVLPANV